MPAQKTKSPEERTKICLQKFAEGVMLGYRIRIFEAIDKRIKEIENPPETLAEMLTFDKNFINGLKSAKTIIENLK